MELFFLGVSYHFPIINNPLENLINIGQRIITLS